MGAVSCDKDKGKEDLPTGHSGQGERFGNYDLEGTVFLSIDEAHNKIVCKVFGLDGAADVYTPRTTFLQWREHYVAVEGRRMGGGALSLTL